MSNLDSLAASTPALPVLTHRQEADGKMETNQGKDRASLLVHVRAAIRPLVDEW